MKKLGNVLYILTTDSYLFCQNDTIAVKIGGTEKVRIPSHSIESIVCLANTTVSTPFIAFCGERGIGLSFHSDYGRFYGRIYGPVSGNVLLRKRQYEILNTQKAADIVRNIVTGKLVNCRAVVMRALRDADDEDVKLMLSDAAQKISDSAQLLDSLDSIDSMRGIEGVAASAYFGVFDCMLKSNDEDMKFVIRSRRPPKNKVNALMSFTYMLLKNDVQSAVESVGLDPAAGYLHTLRPGRPSLALDLMEELRSPLCDRFVISLINRRVITGEDFNIDSGEFCINDKARRNIIDAWQKRKKDDIEHGFLREKIQIGLIPYAQAMLLARFLRGDLDQYPPFIWR